MVQFFTHGTGEIVTLVCIGTNCRHNPTYSLGDHWDAKHKPN